MQLKWQAHRAARMKDCINQFILSAKHILKNWMKNKRAWNGRSSRPKVYAKFYEKFTRKHLCQNLFFLRLVFSCKFCKIFHLSYITLPDDCFCNDDIFWPECSIAHSKWGIRVLFQTTKIIVFTEHPEKKMYNA